MKQGSSTKAKSKIMQNLRYSNSIVSDSRHSKGSKLSKHSLNNLNNINIDRRLKLASKFIASAFGAVRVTTEIDTFKEKYLGVLEIYIKTARQWYSCKFRSGFLLIFIEILRLWMKVPDFVAIKYSFTILSLVCHYFKDYKNAIYSMYRLIGFTEEQDDLETTIKGYEYLASVFNDK